MPFYHIRINYVTGNSTQFVSESNLDDDEIIEIIKAFQKGESFWLDGQRIFPKRIIDFNVFKTKMKSGSLPLNPKYITNVTNHFIKKPVTTVKERQLQSSRKSTEQKKKISQDIFIVHGREHRAVQELKLMLHEFGLNPIVLHEKPGASRTIVEKIEKYSDVGYAFVILTPDDVGALKEEYDANANKMISITDSIKLEDIHFTGKGREEGERAILNHFDRIIKSANLTFLRRRARQNVILEFGYFMGLLGRDKVCCLYTGNVDLPSDMRGIVYVPFKDSINECRLKIMRELTEVGYKIKI